MQRQRLRGMIGCEGLGFSHVSPDVATRPAKGAVPA